MAETRSQTLNVPEEERSLNFGLDDPDIYGKDPIGSDGDRVPTLQNDPGPDEVEETPELEPRETVPDTTEQTQAIGAATNALEDLGYLVTEIRGSHGISRAHALEAERISPGFLTVPSGYYTQAPSATRLKVSLEGLFAKVWEYIKQAIAKIRELMGRFVYWILRKPYPGPNHALSEADVKEHTRKTEELDKQLEKSVDHAGDLAIDLSNESRKGVRFKVSEVPNSDLVADANHDSSGDPDVVQWSDIDRIIGELLGRDPDFEALLQGKDPLLADLLENGPYRKSIVQAVQAYSTAGSQLANKVALLKTTIQQVLSAPPDTVGDLISEQTFSQLTMPLQWGSATGLKDVGSTGEQLQRSSDLVRSRDARPVKYDDIFRVLTRQFDSEVFEHLVAHNAVTAGLIVQINAEFGQIVEAINKGGHAHAMSTDVNWSNVMGMITGDIEMLRRGAVHCQGYHSEIEKLTYRALRFARKVVDRMENAMAPEQANPRIVTLVKRCRVDLSERLKEVNRKFTELVGDV